MAITEVHNCYTLYEIEPDGSESSTQVLSFSRPQDWGDPEGWFYHYCKIEIAGYINHCHIWQQVDRHYIAACQIISQSLFMIMIPGRPRELCDRSHLHGDDFWSKEWGEIPPYYYEEDEDDEAEPLIIDNLYCWRVFHADTDNALSELNTTDPFPEPPFPTAAYLWTLSSDEKGNYQMRSNDKEIITGLLFGTHLESEQKLSKSWEERGWMIERCGVMEKVG